MKYFDNVEKVIRTHSAENIKKLKYCEETIELLKNEKKKYNPYWKLAEHFRLFESGEEMDHEDWYFYKFLKMLDRDDVYIFSQKDGRTVEAKVDLFKPFDEDLPDLVNPQWHLLVSSYAYIDAAFNHTDNTYAQKIIEKTGWTTRKPIRRKFPNKALSKWVEESIKQ